MYTRTMISNFDFYSKGNGGERGRKKKVQIVVIKKQMKGERTLLPMLLSLKKGESKQMKQQTRRYYRSLSPVTSFVCSQLLPTTLFNALNNGILLFFCF